MNDQFSMIISSMGDTIRSAADVLGMGGDAFNAKLNTFVVDLGKISLKDLTGEEQQKALETAFSKLGDDMAKFGVAGLQQYQAVGEGYLETLVRVTNDYMQVSDVLAVLGKSFNATGLGAVALSESLIAAAGGLESLTSGTSYFVENFLTEAERMAPITKSVNDAMGKLGASGVTTVDQFKALVLAQDMNTAAGQAMYAQLRPVARQDVVAAVKIGFCRNYTAQPDLQTSLPIEHKSLYATEWLTETATDEAVRDTYRLDTEPVQIDTCLLRRVDAAAEAARRLALGRAPRTIYEFDGEPEMLLLELGQDVTITYPRFGLDQGEPAVVVSLGPDWITGRCTVGVMA